VVSDFDYSYGAADTAPPEQQAAPFPLHCKTDGGLDLGNEVQPVWLSSVEVRGDRG
jgi:hypothetical protein